LIQREPSEAQQNLKEQQGESELSLSKPNEKKKSSDKNDISYIKSFI